MVPWKTWILENFGLISNHGSVFDGSRRLVFGWFLLLACLDFFCQRFSESPICFFLLGRIFQLHVYSLRNWGRKDEAVYWWAFASFHWRFRSIYLALFVPLSRNFRRLESWENAYSYKSRSQILKVVAKSRIYYSIFPYRCTRMLQMNAPTNRDLLESLFFSIFLWQCYCNSFYVVLSIWSMF